MVEGLKVDAVDRDLGKIAGARAGVSPARLSRSNGANAARSKGRSEHDCSLILAQFRIFELGLLGGGFGTLQAVAGEAPAPHGAIKGKGQSDFSDWPLFMPATTYSPTHFRVQ